ncbi:MAG: hypothetical protein ACI8TQ_003757, partial [Planctomycetota bacterium]
MKLRNLIAVAACLFLGIGIVIYASRVASYYNGTRLELGRVKLSHVDEATAQRLRDLPNNVLATYYVSPRVEMPSHLRQLERQVTDLLEAFRVASEGSFDYQILDPHETEVPIDGQVKSNAEAKYAARQGIAPFRVRSVKQDSWSEETIWSSLTMSYGAYSPAIINGLSREHLPRLAATILAHLDQMEAPERPTVALSAPPGFSKLETELRKLADVERFQFESGTSIPANSDLLFWVRPEVVDAAVLREVDRYLASGRSIVFAGSMQRVQSGARTPDDQFLPAAFQAEPSDYDAAALLGHFGLRPTPGLICDERSYTYVEGDVRTNIPFLIRCIAPNQRFGLVLKGQPNGTLMFEAPTTFDELPEVLSDRGWTPEVLAHTSDETWHQPLPSGPSDAKDLTKATGTTLSRQALITLLRPSDSWRGSVVAMASASSLRDDLIHADGFAHRRLVDVLVRNLADDDRLVINRTSQTLPEALPELTNIERLKWRTVTVFLIPAALLLLALVRGAFGARSRRQLPIGKSGVRTSVLVVAVFIVGLVVIRLAGNLSLRADWTENGLNQLASTTAELARETGSQSPLVAEIFLSKSESLPPNMRRSAAKLDQLLGDLRRAGANVKRTLIDPSQLTSDERDALQEAGIRPKRMTSREEGATTVRTIYSVMRLSGNFDGAARSELLNLTNSTAFDDLEFRVAFALWRLKTGRTPRIAFASDTPRLSPAEAHMDYQLKGGFAPAGDDPYGAARMSLHDVGFEILHVNPREPDLSGEFDALVWLQPRRNASAMIDALANYMHRGGRALLCAQHYNLQARQYRGTNFDTVYWPQPQSPDIDRLWFPELGIDLVRTVLFDELKTSRTIETQVNRNADNRDYELQTSALPFLIRASTANFGDDPVMNGIGDLSFIWGNHIDWDSDRLRELNIQVEPLIKSSERTWSFDWQGGYLPQEVFEGFPTADSESVKRLPERTLAARFTGQFPLPVEPLGEGLTASVSDAPAAPGELVLVGNSEMFKNGLLLGPEFRADTFLINAVADLVLPPNLASIAGRRQVARGLDYMDGDE